MHIEQLLSDKRIKPKEKTQMISEWISDKSLPVDELISFAEKQKDAAKATCIEALEYATKQNPGIADKDVLNFAINSLTQKAPRVKWESAKVIGNIAHLFPEDLGEAVSNLLINTGHEGTVVRWSAAFALGEILKLNANYNAKLLPQIESLCEKEEKNSIKKIYNSAIKKIKS